MLLIRATEKLKNKQGTSFLEQTLRDERRKVEQRNGHFSVL